ncbi:hypothetical protein AOLI_G00312440 [Acnodon oligacanthus]
MLWLRRFGAGGADSLSWVSAALSLLQLWADVLVRVLYSDIESVLQVNGGLCAPFEVGRGIRQGCSLSGMLYAITIESMLCRLRRDLSGVQVEKQTSQDSLYWFLQDPAVHGAQLSLTEGGARSLSERIRKVGLVMVRHLVETAEVDLNDAEAVAQRLGIRSCRVTMQMLHRVQQALAEEDRKLLTGWTHDQTGKEEEGPFPCLWVSPDVTVADTGSPLLTLEGLRGLHLDCLNAKVMYRGCVKQLNQSKLTGQVDTPWRAHFGLASDIKPA